MSAAEAGHGGAPEAVVGFAFGYREGPDGPEPGLSNEQLAQVAADFAEEHENATLILQFEIADALKKLDGSLKPHRVERHSTEGEYLDTREVAVQAAKVLTNLGVDHVGVLAHPAHTRRCALTLRHLGYTTETLDNRKVDYDPESAQEWTRSADKFIPREQAATAVYAGNGWIDLKPFQKK